MSVILIFMLPETGHIHSTFKLCKQLINNGHRVIHVGIPDMEPLVKAQNIEFYKIGEEFFPAGFLKKMNEKILESSLIGQLKILKNYIKTARKLFQDLYLNEFKKILNKFNPDLIITDALLPFAGIIASSSGIKVLSLSITLPVEFTLKSPPISSYCIPLNGFKRKTCIVFKWFVKILEILFWEFIGILVGVDLWKEIRYQVKLWKFPRNKVKYIATFLPYIKLEELVLSPLDFEFDFVKYKMKHYIGSYIYIERKEGEFDFIKKEKTDFVIYCAFGTQAFRVPKVKETIQNIINIVSRHENWELVIATGLHGEKYKFNPKKDNIHIYNYVPQIKMLKHADLFITHGGFNSIKESIIKKVPMLVIPLTRDQPGNASRVVFHKIGLACKLNKASEKRLEKLIIEVKKNKEIKSNLDRMAEKFIKIENKKLGLELIERILKD